MNKPTNDEIRQNVRKHYQQIAVKEVNRPAAGSCCGAPSDADALSSQIGYSTEELTAVPQGANLGLGCGNPQAIAELKVGEIVLDLGSGGGFDCFLASRQVGGNGKVIGVDMTPDMVSRARSNAVKGNFTNTDFRLGEIEHLPVADGTVDVIISNCVINLSPDKQQVFNEAFRVLKSGGRLAISDIITTAELPSEIKNDLSELYSGCISGASSLEEVKSMLLQSGFTSISIEPKDESKSFIKDWVPGANVDNYIVSAIIKAKKA
ncbi:arsenite methyltransferase [Paenibacillus sp. EKM202P]|uniref:arsenite methyltransferase n=1 Tax=unclassified Paenibacillus TaxID=185978 RepID=UPI0013EE334C|nr:MULTISPECIES: arsenite methyltransferase [unclassified Paenibacillus]KAF6558379.1 arsenite methyltransferase [Paenibacillus sp. EKM202P]KAF6563539.1 arsenite methyltransferase [Paenibacillus sp. EKM207P]MCV9951188.1 arsenite methyltransferase [Paenibacillus sp. BT-177]